MNKYLIFNKIKSFLMIIKGNLYIKRLALILVIISVSLITLLVLFNDTKTSEDYLDLLSRNKGKTLSLSLVRTTDGSIFDSPTRSLYDSPNNTLYILNKGGFITVIDTNEFSFVYKIFVGRKPESMQFNPNVGKIYITTNGSAVIVVDLRKETIKTVLTGSKVKLIALNTVDNKLYILNQVGNEISILDSLTDTIVSRIKLSIKADYIDILKLPYVVYVSSREDSVLEFINGDTEEIFFSGKLDFIPTFLFPAKSGSNLYVAGKNPNTVVVFDVLTGIEKIRIRVAGRPVYSLLTKDEDILYIANNLLDKDNLMVVNAKDWSTLATSDIEGKPSLIKASTDKIYVLNSANTNISILDKNTNSLIKMIRLPNSYDFIHFSKVWTEEKLFLVSKSNEISELNVDTMEVTKTLRN